MQGSPSQGRCPPEDASSARNASLLQAPGPSPPQQPLPAYAPSYLAHIKGIHPIRSWALAQTGPALGPCTLLWEEMCRRAGRGRESTPPRHPPLCALRAQSHRALPVVTLTDAGSDYLQGPLAREMHLVVGCPDNISCGSLQTAESRWAERVNC